MPSHRRGRYAHGLARPESRLVERLVLAPQVVHRPRQPRRQDRQHSALAPLLELLLLPALGPLAAAQKQAGGLGEGPADVRVADLLTAGSDLLAGRLVAAAHQP